MTDEPEVLTRIDNGVGRLTLNRPKAINSLTQTMVDIMATTLADWAADDAVRLAIAAQVRAGVDVVIIGRNPSLNDKSMSCFFLRISADLESNAMEINVSAVDSFAGDFDGDQMSGKFLKDVSARTEAALVMGFTRDLQYIKSGTPVLGQMQDSILGCALLTYHDVRVSRKVALHLVRNCQRPPAIPMQDELTPPMWRRVGTGEEAGTEDKQARR